MMRARKLLSAGSLLLVFGCGGGSSTPTATGNLVANGDFESPTVEGYAKFAGPTTVNGWQVEPESVEWVHTDIFTPAHGAQSCDLNGADTGAIYQNLATVAGHTYHLRFAFAGNPDLPPAVKTMAVYWGTTLVDRLSFDTTGHSDTDLGWTYHEYTVVGTGKNRLRFASETANSGAGPVVDDVSVMP